MFHTLGDSLPRRGALMQGAALSLILLGAVTFSIGRGGGKSPRLLIGASYSRGNVLGIDRSSVAVAEPATALRMTSRGLDREEQRTAAYFRLIRVLGVLDRDRNFVLSAREIRAGASALRRLDTDGDGALNAEECGFASEGVSYRVAEQGGLYFMRQHPVLATLDGDHDSSISAGEITDSPAALRRLDTDGDGSLTPGELLPALWRLR
jgi:hypothetical protein